MAATSAPRLTGAWADGEQGRDAGGSPRPPDERQLPLRPSSAVLDARIGARLLAEVGFLLVPCDAAVPGPAYLFVAIRRRPTLDHFDPELVEYWRSVDLRGTPSTLDGWLTTPVSEPVSWGAIRIVDRLSVANEFLSCGGWLEAGRIDGMTVAVFSSPAPILCGRGHSQARDPGAQVLAAFLARLREAAGTDPAAETRIDGETPTARYAAFIADAQRRSRAAPSLRATDAPTFSFVDREASRLQGADPAAWRAGRALLMDLGMATGGNTRATADR